METIKIGSQNLTKD